jgi:TonB family protein
MYWVSLLVHSAAILAAANLLGRFPRKLAPLHRHRLLLAGFGLLLVWPLLSAAMPQIHLPLWTYWRTEGSITVQQTILSFRPTTATPHAINWPFLIWIAGVFLAAAPIISGRLNLLRITHRAIPLRDAASRRLLAELCGELGVEKAPALLTIPGPVMPFTFGLRHPHIVLPADYTAWSTLRQRTVLLHELAHIQRWDVLTQLFASVVTAIWWFQPLCWINRRSLRRESEQTCDALVLASGVRPSDYATQLFEMARSFSKGQYLSSAVITMARRGELEGRMHAILDPQPGDGARKRPFAAVAALTFWSIAASAITLTPQPQTTSSGGISMKRTFLSGLLSLVGLSAATIGGSLFDPSGAAVPQAKASLYNPETKATAETTTTPEDKFAFDNLPAGQYILRVDKPGFSSLFREFNVQAESKLERGLTLQLGAKEEAGNTQVAKGERTAYAQPSDSRQVRIGGAVAQANLITKVQPLYPASAKAAGIQGTVNLETVISKDGVPEDIRVISSPSDDITQSALEAVRQWRYRPTLLNGEPIEVVTNVIVNYTLAP